MKYFKQNECKRSMEKHQFLIKMWSILLIPPCASCFSMALVPDPVIIKNFDIFLQGIFCTDFDYSTYCISIWLMLVTDYICIPLNFAPEISSSRTLLPSLSLFPRPPCFFFWGFFLVHCVFYRLNRSWYSFQSIDLVILNKLFCHLCESPELSTHCGCYWSG